MAKQSISVIERRLQGPNVFRSSSQPIPLKDPKWTVRWENTTISPDHIWNIINVLGWQYVGPEDLDCRVDEIGATERDGHVVRGTRGDEVLVKMLLRDYRRVEKRKTEETIKQTFGKKQLKDTVLTQVAAEHGSQAADYVNANLGGISVTDGRGPEE